MKLSSIRSFLLFYKELKHCLPENDKTSPQIKHLERLSLRSNQVLRKDGTHSMSIKSIHCVRFNSMTNISQARVSQLSHVKVSISEEVNQVRDQSALAATTGPAARGALIARVMGPKTPATQRQFPTFLPRTL